MRWYSSGGTDGTLTALRITPDVEIIDERARRLDADQFLSLSRRRGDVRRGDHLRQLLQAVIDGGLLLIDVERGAADLTGLDGVGERALVDQLTARRIDHSKATLAGREPRRH